MKYFRILFLGLACVASGQLSFPLHAEQNGSNVPRPPKLDLESSRPQQWAVLIGVDDYAEMADNQYCANSVYQLRGRLIASGFPDTNIYILHDNARQRKYLPSKVNIEQQLALIPKLAGKGDLLLVVFSGHAAKIGGKSYLFPIEAQPDAPKETLISMEYIYRQMTGSSAKHKLLVIDAGRSVAGLPSEAITGFLRSLEKPPAGVHVLVGCQSGQVPTESDQLSGSAFMQSLFRGLEGEADTRAGNNDKQTSLVELASYVRSEANKQAAATGSSTPVPALYGEKQADFEIAQVGQYTLSSDYPTISRDPVASSARLEAVAAVNPRSLAAFNRAVAHFAQQNSSEAIEYCNEAIRRDSGNRWAYILRSSAYCMQGNFAKAVDDYQRLGIPLPCRVKYKTAQLKDGEKVLGTVSKGERLYVTKANGQWLWVDAVGKDKTRQGWIYQKHVE